jgi:hypothetical protein
MTAGIAHSLEPKKAQGGNPVLAAKKLTMTAWGHA